MNIYVPVCTFVTFVFLKTRNGTVDQKFLRIFDRKIHDFFMIFMKNHDFSFFRRGLRKWGSGVIIPDLSSFCKAKT